MEFLLPLADASNYPKPKILALPKKLETKRTVTGTSERILPENVESIGVCDHARTGLSVIATTITSQKVWLPSYHCPALVEPFLAEGKKIEFYPVTESLSPDFLFLSSKLQKGDALVGIRYFGFSCGIKKLAELCHQKQVLMVEDLAHAAFFSELYADLAVTSLIKFYPVDEGGELLVLKDSQWLASLKTNLSLLPNNKMVAYKEILKKIYHKVFSLKQSNYGYFLKNKCSKTIKKSNLNTISNTVQQDVINARQKNYRYLVSKLTKSVLGRVLMPELTNDITPYVVPFLLNSPNAFDHIRQQGIQIYRWEEMVATDFEFSQKYRDKLIQLPCHQDLSLQQLDFIVKVLMEECDENT